MLVRLQRRRFRSVLFSVRKTLFIVVCWMCAIAHAQAPTTRPALVGQQILERESTGAPGQVELWICAQGAQPNGDDVETAGPCVVRCDERGFMLEGDFGLKIHIRDQDTITVDGQFTSVAGASEDFMPPLMRATHASYLFQLVIPRLVTPADIVNVKQEVDEAKLASSDPQALMNYLHHETLRGNLLPMVRYMSEGEEFQATPADQTREQFMSQLHLTPEHAKNLSTDDLFVRVLRNTFWFEWTKVLKVKVVKIDDDHAKVNRIRLDGAASSDMKRVKGKWIPGS